jgi:putative ABC transport system substrate-binding protein
VLGGIGLLPFAARGQQAVPVIGVLSSASSGDYAAGLAAFHGGLRESGYVDGQNVKLEYVYADEQYDRLPELAANLARRQVISLNRPAGNFTGAAHLNVEIAPKRLELLHELLPSEKVMALLVNPTNPITRSVSAEVNRAATALGIELRVIQARDEDEIDRAVVALRDMKVGALVIGTDPLFTSRAEKIGGLSLRAKMPAIYQYREFVAGGGLMSYGGNNTDSYYHAGIYAGRILKGEKPANLPVQLSTKVQFFLNLKSARQLGLSVPLSLSGRADEVVE